MKNEDEMHTNLVQQFWPVSVSSPSPFMRVLVLKKMMYLYLMYLFNR